MNSPSGPSSQPGTALVPDDARQLFGVRLPLAERFHGWLADQAVVRGLIGPREVDRLWDRHLLNCAILTDLIPPGARVVDVGSGAGLPGVPMAIRRADLTVDLVEPMQRRTQFLGEVVADLGLADTVRVVRGRAEDADVLRTAGGSDWVVARAVAPLDRLVRWCLPLLSPGGTLLALKGAGARDEVARHGSALRAAGAAAVSVEELGGEVLGERTWVVVVSRASARQARKK